MTTHEILNKYWGYSVFRPLQEEIINSVINGKDTLALLPTGGGKSICFQVPALALDGLCLVVSPLIALMKDQVENLSKRGIEAKAIYSGMSYREIEITLDNCIYNNEIKFLYLSPERLKSEIFKVRLKQMKINLIAVDEAHCISQWGFDFRPEYRQIAELRQYLPKTPIIALTATATKNVVEDIQLQLNFSKKNVFQKSYERKNLRYIVRFTQDKNAKTLEILKKTKGSGLIYAQSRKRTEELASFLMKEKISADFYHAGLPYELRMKKQNDWISSQTRVMVCSNAFGMGIDKPDCRVVVHYDLPDCLEAYYQESGRAGRDELQSFCVLLFNKTDELAALDRIKKNFPDENEIRRIYQALCDYFQMPLGAIELTSFDFNIAEFCKRYKFQPVVAFSCLKILEQCDLIVLSESFFEPSRIRIILNGAELYKFQVENELFDEFIKTLLRTYAGLFDMYVPINEKVLSDRTKQSVEGTKKTLRKLEKSRILEYLEQKDKSQLTFVQTRISAENIRFDKALLSDRKKNYKEKIKEILNYSNNTNSCRSKLLLEYFNEFGAEDCGVCDICSQKNKSRLELEKYLHLQSEIKVKVIEKPQSPTELFEYFSQLNSEIFVALIRDMLQEGELKYDNQYKLHWTKKIK